MSGKKVLVSGATGKQGGAVVNALIKDGHHVIGFTRNPDSAKARKLIDQGVEMIKYRLFILTLSLSRLTRAYLWSLC